MKAFRLASRTALSATAWRARPLPGLAAGLRTTIPRTRHFASSAVRQSDDDGERKWSTPLAKQLANAIAITGPVPLASFMRMCLTADVGGYYTGALDDGSGRDPFGRAGDFVTSPEVSQVFGELIGIWFVAEWMSQGRPTRGVELMEVGPGRGTLMADILRTIRLFDLGKHVETVYMVEASPQLRETQRKLLCGEGTDAGVASTSAIGYHSVTTPALGSLPIVWSETIQSIPKRPDSMPLIVAHEFFDALPIHTFQSVVVPPKPESKQKSEQKSEQSSADAPPTKVVISKPGSPSRKAAEAPVQWRELVVTPTPPGSTHESLGTPRSQRPTNANGTGTGSPVPDFQLTVAKDPTRHSVYLPESSPRYQKLLESNPPTGGAIIEICPDAALYAADFAARIGGTPPQHPKPRPMGAALILDYGPGDGSIPVNSLRGIRRHERVSPFAEPGLTDLSADVDFEAIAETATQASEGVEVHGPVEQAAFLLSMGIRERAQALQQAVAAKAKAASKAESKTDTEERIANIEKAWRRLVDRGPNGMGKVYKALAILPENSGRRRPVGFGGDVQ